MKTILLVVTLLLAGCATNGSSGGGFFDPTVVAANERYVTLYDSIGIPGKMEQTATAHCQKFGRIAQFQSKGGDGYQCSGRNSNLCSTYTCVN